MTLSLDMSQTAIKSEKKDAYDRVDFLSESVAQHSLFTKRRSLLAVSAGEVVLYLQDAIRCGRRFG